MKSIKMRLIMNVEYVVPERLQADPDIAVYLRCVLADCAHFLANQGLLTEGTDFEVEQWNWRAYEHITNAEEIA